MKSFLLLLFGAASLTAASATAAPAALSVGTLTVTAPLQGPLDRRNKDFNYGYPKGHRVTAKERARWEAEQKRLAALKRRDKDFNYGYPKGHIVTPKERARWEATH